MEQLTALLKRVHSSGAEFVLIGGLAAVLHGATLGTFVVDICARFTPENLRRISGALTDLNPKFSQRKDLPFVLSDDLLATVKNLYLQTDWGRLDCLGEVAGLGDYEAVLRHSEWTQFEFGRCRVLQIDALIRAKEPIGRPQDLLITTQLRAIQERNSKHNSSSS